MKKFFVVSSFLGIFLTGSSLVFATFTDVKESDFYFQAIDFLDDEDIVSGYQDGSFGYGNFLNRAEMLKIVVTAKFLNQEKSFLNGYNGAECFDDVLSNQWYTGYVCYAKSQGWISGYADGTFKPEGFINFVEALKIVMWIFGDLYEESDPWYKSIVEGAAEQNLIPLTINDFAKFVTRGEMADMIARKIKYDKGYLEGFLGKEKFSFKVTYDTILAEKDLSLDFLNCFASGTCLQDEIVTEAKQCSYDGNTYDIGEFFEQDSCTRVTCLGPQFLTTDLCLSYVAAFDDYYEKIVKVSNLDLGYDEYGNVELSFDLSNSSKAPLENTDLRIFFLNEVGATVLEYGGAVSVLAGKTSEYKKIELKEDIEKLNEIVSVDFYMDGNFFGSEKISPYQIRLKFKWSKAGNSYIDFLLEDYELKAGQKFYVRCDSSSDPDAPHFYNGVQASFQIENLLPNTDYACTVSLFDDDVKSRQSEVLTIRTLE